jgi:hypothetical protein
MAATNDAFTVTVMVTTRAEYLAGSLSRRQPWLAEGISRRQWERRRRKITTVESIMPAQRRTLRRHDENLLMRRVYAYWDTHGMTQSDPEALSKAVHSIILPARFKHMDRRALSKICRKARKCLPVAYDQWVALIEKWDKSYDRGKARDLVDRLVTAVGDRPLGIIGRMFDHLGQQICDHLPKKVRRLEYECERLKNDKYYLPQLRPLKTDAIKEQVYAALADGPKTKRELGRMFWKPYGAISSVGLRLRNEGLITTIRLGGQFMWARACTAPRFIPARDAIVVALRKGPMTVQALAQKTGKGKSTVKSALYRHLLPNGTVVPVKFGTYALAGTEPPYVSKADAIVAALEKSPMHVQALAQETHTTLLSLYQFLGPLLAKRKIIRTGRGIYALPGQRAVYTATCDAIISALTKQTMKLGPLVQRVRKSTKSTVRRQRF